METNNNGGRSGWSFEGKKYGRLSATHPEFCPRDHAYKGANLLSRVLGTKRECRACVNANRWANRKGIPIDDPRTIAKAHEYYLKYIAEDNPTE